jgi:hypothetical protein
MRAALALTLTLGYDSDPYVMTTPTNSFGALVNENNVIKYWCQLDFTILPSSIASP